MIASYRDPRYAASLRIDRLREQHDRFSDDVPEDLIQLHGRRVARSCAGAVAIIGFIAMVAAALLDAVADNPHGQKIIHPTLVLLCAGPAAVVTYFVARLAARRSFVQRVRASLASHSDPLSRLALLENGAVRRAAKEAAYADEKRSIALPMCGISLLAPLSIHLAVSLLWGKLADFGWWISASLVLVGVAHLVLCGVSVYFAREVAKSSTLLLEHKIPVSGWAALGLTVAGACLPGIIAIAIPPILVFITGAFFVPAMFNFMYRRAIDERRALEL